MADDVEMTPVEMTPVAAEPPKVNPLPPKPGATVSALKPGLKLPPKPGATIAMKPGLKLPPKPGATIAMKPGLKLPPKPGATIAMKPGLKLPPKPGLSAGVKPAIPKPLPKPVAPGVIPPPVAATPAPAPAPTPAPQPAPAANTLETLKTVTQKLKGVTQQIPQQAVLHKTGIIADSASSDAQKEAAKHKTARISLSDAMGVAPVKNEPAPMKTIRIKRPIDIPASGAAEKPAEASAPEAGATSADATSLTQRKTIKITRPGVPVRPAGKFGVKKPGATVVSPKLPTPAGVAPAEGAGEIADIPEIPDLPPVPPMPTAAVAEAKAGPFTLVAALIALVACVTVGVLVKCLYENGQLPTFCGGLGWGA